MVGNVVRHVGDGHDDLLADLSTSLTVEAIEHDVEELLEPVEVLTPGAESWPVPLASPRPAARPAGGG